MNHLGHLFLSNNDLDLMICNLHGEYIKGKTFDHYHASIQKGIVLHRAIDFYTDSHPVNIKLKKYFYSELPKVSGLAIDLFYDHILAKKWDSYHHLTLNLFLDQFFNYTSPLEKDMHPLFRVFMKNFREHQWIKHYSSDWGLHKMCEGVSKKLSFQNALSHASVFYSRNTNRIDEAFEHFISDAKLEFG